MAGIGSRPRGCGQESLRSTCGWGLPLTPKAPGFAECSLYNCYSANTCSKWSDFQFSAHSGTLALACFLAAGSCSSEGWRRRITGPGCFSGTYGRCHCWPLTFWCLQAVLGLWPHHFSPPLTFSFPSLPLLCVSLCMPLDSGPGLFYHCPLTLESLSLIVC